MQTRQIWLGVCLFGVAGIAWGAIPFATPEQLQERSTEIVTGQVLQIYEHDENDENWIKKSGVVELRIDQVAKGNALKPGGLVYVRYWTQEWNGKQGLVPPHGAGHELPQAGDTVRAFLQLHKDGGMGAVLPNGFEVLKSAPIKQSRQE